MEQKEVTVMKSWVTKLENQANAITIETKEDHKKAVDLVATLKETGSKIKSKKESITKPLNEALRNARSLFKPIEDQFAEAERIIKGKLLDHTKKVNEEARKKEEALANRVEKGTMKHETAEKKLDDIERVDNTTKGDVGKVQIKKIKKVRISDEEKLRADIEASRKYLVPDMVAIRRDALSGKEIPGVEVYEEETIAAGSI